MNTAIPNADSRKDSTLDREDVEGRLFVRGNIRSSLLLLLVTDRGRSMVMGELTARVIGCDVSFDRSSLED